MIVLPMAGRSSRFAKAGYTKPKYMLEAHGRTVFEHVVASFEGCFGKERFLFIALATDDVSAFVAERCVCLGLAPDQYRLVELPAPTEGQAETLAKGLLAAAVPADEPLTVFNIDTIRPGFRYPDEFALADVDGYLEVFEAEGDGWSFVEPVAGTQDYSVRRVTEKVRISDLCSTGLYYFRSVSLFLDVYAGVSDVPVGQLQGGERYIAPLYNRLIERGCRIKYHMIGADEIILCGVPAEYEAFRTRKRA